MFRKFTLFALSGCMMMVAGVTQADIVVVADIGGDWISASTLPTGWSYFDATAANGGTLTALSANQVVGGEGSTGFGGGNNGLNLGAVIGDNANGGDYEIFGDGQLNGGVLGNDLPPGETDLIVHPGSSTQLGNPKGDDYLILRYTISASDILNGTSATIAGSFRNLVPDPVTNSITGYVFQNDSELFSASGTGGTLTQLDGTFNLSTTVAAGDTIDFVIYNNGNVFADETAIRGTISLTAIPEPTIFPIGIAIVGLIAGRRRR